MIRNSKMGCRAVLAVCVSMTLALGQALAQEESGSQAEAPDDSARGTSPEMLQDVVVTATKRKDLSQNVPSAITAITGAQLEHLGAVQLSDLVANVPGLNLISSGGTIGQNELTLRGISSGLTTGSTVGIYVDDVPFGSSSSLADGGQQALDLFPFDLARVEVLKGPQGTLYGANSLSGLLKYVTNAPDPTKFAGLVEADGADIPSGGSGGAVKAMLNLPIVLDKVGLRASGYYQKDPGWIDNVGTGQHDANAADEYGFRAGLLIAPIDGLTVRLGALVQNTHADGTNLVPVNPVTHDPIYGVNSLTTLLATPYDSRTRLYSATIHWDTPLGQFVSASSYSKLSTLSVADTTPNFGVPTVGYNGDYANKWTQEFRLESSSDRTIDYLFGLFYTSESSGHPQDYEFIPRTTEPFGIVINPSEYREYAGFGDLTWHITQKMSLAVGGRYSDISQYMSDTEYGAAIGPSTLYTSGTVHNHVGTWSVSPSYQIKKDTLLYARIATGFQPGGSNIVFPGQTLPPTFSPDTTTNYEVGVKSTFRNRLQIDFDVFDIEWQHIILLETFIDPINGAELSGNGNGSNARSRGAELAAKVIPIRGLSIGVNGAYTDARLTAPAPAEGGLNGDTLPYVPTWSGALIADYTFAVGSETGGFVGASFSYEGARNSYFSQSAKVGNVPFELGAYTDLDLRAGLTMQNWTFTIYGKNVTNNRGEVAATTTGVGGPAWEVLLQPATIGVRISRAF